MCASLDTVSGMVGLVVDGEVLEEKVHQEVFKEDENRPSTLNINIGYLKEVSSAYEVTGQISNLNMYSAPLTTERMVAITQAGSEECGAPGDFLNWEEAQWKLTSKSKIEMVGELEGPCRRESVVNVYTAVFLHQRGCMEHCKKIGDGRIPPVRTGARDFTKRA